MEKSDYRFVGTLVKPFGFRGEYVMVSDAPMSEDMEDWESVFIEIDGLLVPFFIDAFRFSSESSAIIGFEDIDSSEAAREFVSCRVFQLSSAAGEPEPLEPKLLEGYKVIDAKAGNIGVVDQILNYNQNLLLSVLKGKTEILIPVSDEIVTKINHRKREVLISAPEGLLELYL
jgi:16S rRNA processing protein RimM